MHSGREGLECEEAARGKKDRERWILVSGDVPTCFGAIIAIVEQLAADKQPEGAQTLTLLVDLVLARILVATHHRDTTSAATGARDRVLLAV